MHPPIHRYHDRSDAGRQLAQALSAYRCAPHTLVLALPRGGVPVAYKIAQALQLPLDVYIVRKLGVPWHEELAMGAIGPNNTLFLNQSIINNTHVTEEALQQVIEKEKKEQKRRETLYRANKKPLLLTHQTIILVDDGIATGASVHAALLALRAAQPKQIILAVPLAAPDTLRDLQPLADTIICPVQTGNFGAVGAGYVHFEQTSDDTVLQLLANNMQHLSWKPSQ